MSSFSFSAIKCFNTSVSVGEILLKLRKILANYAHLICSELHNNFCLMHWDITIFVQGKQNSLELYQCRIELLMCFSIPKPPISSRGRETQGRKTRQKDKMIWMLSENNGCLHYVIRLRICRNASNNLDYFFFNFWPHPVTCSPTRNQTYSPTLKGRVLTTGPPGKSPVWTFDWHLNWE